MKFTKLVSICFSINRFKKRRTNKKKIKEKRRKKIMRKLAKWFEEALESYVKLMGNTYGWGGRL